MSLIPWISLLPSPCAASPGAQPVDVRRLCKTHVHVRSTLKIQAVANAALRNDRNDACQQQQSAERVEVLRLAHPVDIGLFEKLDHARFGFPSLDSKGFPFVPGAVGVRKRRTESSL